MPTTGYRFLVVTPDGHWWLNGSGLHRAGTDRRRGFSAVAGFDPPGWLADRVFYQVFPDRFANGDPANDVADGAWTYRGNATRQRTWDEPPGRRPAALVEFFGGDLAGLESRLDHLLDLGVNAIYLNPVFETRSNHGYDTIDYGRVAAHFGGDEALASLRRATRERDIAAHPRRRAEPHRRGTPVVPRGPGGPGGTDQRLLHLPRAARRLCLVARGPARCRSSTTGSSELRDAMYAGPEAVLRRWLRPPFSVDGWRIDVANMLGRLGPDQLGAGGRARASGQRSRTRTPMRTSSASTPSTGPISSPATSGTAS